jgi:molybdenum cofactor biosynthesis enzyme MoaA
VDVRFIEYMPFNDNDWQTGGFVSYAEMQQAIGPLERLQDGPNDTTKWWTLPTLDTADIHTNQESPTTIPTTTTGRIGFITSMSEHFCGTCNRLRLTADGQLKVCLFGKTEVSLRDLIRTYPDRPDLLMRIVHASVQRKHAKLGGHKDMQDIQAHSKENRPMILIGG